MQPSARLIGFTQPFQAEDLKIFKPQDLIEFSGRWDYGPKSISKMGESGIIKRWLDSGEESMIEMVDAIFFITCSRVVSHEFVRHRIASYQQESQRFVRYEDEPWDDLFYVPDGLDDDTRLFMISSYGNDMGFYQALLERHVPKQLARYVLPNAMRTRMVVKMNLRAWRHVLGLRIHKSAQPEMRVVMRQIYDQLYAQFPEMFSDIDPSGEGIRSNR